MTGDQKQMAQEFIKRIRRPVDRKWKDNGYNLFRPNGAQFGYVRYNIMGDDRDKYRIYSKGSLDDNGKWNQGWKKWPGVAPCDEEGVRCAVRVLELCYDHSG